MSDPNEQYLDALSTDEDPQDSADRIFSAVDRDNESNDTCDIADQKEDSSD